MKSRRISSSVSSPMSVPCAGCRLLRRRCSKDCIFLPHFPAGEPEKFAAVHRVFGASNVSKMLHEIPLIQREDAATSLVYEANARLKDPVYGCVASIVSLQQQVSQLQSEIAVLLAETITLRSQLSEALSVKARGYGAVDSAYVAMPALSHACLQDPMVGYPPLP